jgi:hypothetical protein
MNTKVVGLATNNNFYKSHIGFSAQIKSYLNANFEYQQGLANSDFWLALDFSSFSPQNLKCQST